MTTGYQIVAAIEYGVSMEVREIQENYETQLELELEQIGRLGAIQSSMALKLTMRQIRTLRQKDRDENALAIFRTNFPEVSNKSDHEIRVIIEELNNIERKAGRAEVMKTKIIRSNIHTVLKPLDEEWTSRFGIGLLQISPSIIQTRAEELLRVRVQNSRQFEVWQGKVFELFVDALVFRGYAGRESKPVGTIDPGQLRLYRRNWSEWCEKNSSKVLELASQKSIKELTENRTRSYNINAELRRINLFKSKNLHERIEEVSKVLSKDEPANKFVLGGMSDLATLSTLGEASEYRLKVELSKNQSFQAERLWADRDDVLNQFESWVSSLLSVWGYDGTGMLIILNSRSAKGLSKVEFQAMSAPDALNKIRTLVTIT
jgi:hypothetical protein